MLNPLFENFSDYGSTGGLNYKGEYGIWIAQITETGIVVTKYARFLFLVGRRGIACAWIATL
jgi:hypothetical protein